MGFFVGGKLATHVGTTPTGLALTQAEEFANWRVSEPRNGIKGEIGRAISLAPTGLWQHGCQLGGASLQCAPSSKLLTLSRPSTAKRCERRRRLIGAVFQVRGDCCSQADAANGSLAMTDSGKAIYIADRLVRIDIRK